MKTNKNGISLIVLVITIIVMIILAGAIVLSLSRTDIFNKAEEAVQRTDMAQINHIAQLAWAEAYLDSEGKATVEELKESVEKALEDNKLNPNDYVITVTNNGVDIVLKAEVLNPSGTIPQGATYYVCGTSLDLQLTYTDLSTIATATFTAGQEFPATPQTGDVYVYDCYVYIYNGYALFDRNLDEEDMDPQWFYVDSTQNGWGLYITDRTRATYEILYTIAEKPVVDLTHTFISCTNIVTAPTIPDSVTDMYGTFAGCTSLTSVTQLPKDVTNMNSTFVNCAALTSVPTIPENVKFMYETFKGCTSLTGALVVDANPTHYTNCLKDTQVSSVTGKSTLKDEIFATSPLCVREITFYVKMDDANSDYSEYSSEVVTYKALSTMDWETWIASDYNTEYTGPLSGNTYKFGDVMSFNDGNVWWFMGSVSSSAGTTKLTDKIIEGHTYNVYVGM